jgi:hypothetical protein
MRLEAIIGWPNKGSARRLVIFVANHRHGERLLNDHNINRHLLLVYIQYKASLSAKPWAQTNPNLKRHTWTLSVT